MEVVMTTGAIRRGKLHPNRHHQQTNTQIYYRTDALLSNSVRALKAESITFHRFAHSKLTYRVGQKTRATLFYGL